MAHRLDLFAHVINQMQSGALQEELSKKLNACVVRSRETGKPSELTLKIKIKPIGNSGQYELTEDVVVKTPRPELGKTLMFGTQDGNLTRQDPNQRDLPLKSVEQETPADLKQAEDK